MIRRLVLLLAGSTLMAACGGDVANSGSSVPSPSTAPSTNPCQIGSDPTIGSDGGTKPDSFTEGAELPATPQPTGLQTVDLKVGTGALIGRGQCVWMHYTGWLQDGTKFDSSRDHNASFRFQLGAGQVIKGWDLGVPRMGVGGRRRLTIPPALGYPNGSPPTIPANATLVFIVEALKAA